MGGEEKGMLRGQGGPALPIEGQKGRLVSRVNRENGFISVGAEVSHSEGDGVGQTSNQPLESVHSPQALRLSLRRFGQLVW